MSKSRTQIERESKNNVTVHDVSKWNYKCKNSKKIWNTILWLYKNDLLTEKGMQLYYNGYKGHNGILKIKTTDLKEAGNIIMRTCYPTIQDKFDRVDTILSRCYKKL